MVEILVQFFQNRSLNCYNLHKIDPIWPPVPDWCILYVYCITQEGLTGPLLYYTLRFSLIDVK